MMTHLVTPLPYPILEGPFLRDARSRFNGTLMISRDGTEVMLPAACNAIEQRQRA